MNRLTSLLQALGAAGATANARAELESAHLRTLQAAIVANRVKISSMAVDPLSMATGARVA